MSDNSIASGQYDAEVAATTQRKTVVCMSPRFPPSITTTSFAINVDGADISNIVTMDVIMPPNVIFSEPLAFRAHSRVTFNLIFDSAVTAEDGLKPFILYHNRTSDNLMTTGAIVSVEPVSVTYTGAMMSFTFEDGFAKGSHNVTVAHLGGAEVFRWGVVSNTGINVHSVTPLNGFATSSTTITLTMSAAIDQAMSTQCCFTNGDGKEALHSSPASLVSNNEWRCHTPRLGRFEGKTLQSYTVGLSYGGGACEESPFKFDFYTMPTVHSISPSSGSVLGGTPVEIEFSRGISEAGRLSVATSRCTVALASTYHKANSCLRRLFCACRAPPIRESSTSRLV